VPVTLYALLTWTTFRREASIDASVAPFLRRFLPTVAHRHGVQILEMGVVSDHLHIVLALPSIVQGLKGASSRVANRDRIVAEGKLRWASGYDLRSVSPKALPQVMSYVRRQTSHHPCGRIPDGGVAGSEHSRQP